MKHKMKLRSQPFNMIRSGQKTYGNTAQKVPGTAGCDIIALWINR